MRQCAICHKSSIMAGERRKLRGKYNPVNWRRKHANLQYARLPLLGEGVGGQAKARGVRKLICTQCLRTMKNAAK